MTQVQSRYFASTSVPAALTSSLGTTGNPQVSTITGWPTQFPFVALIDWGSFLAGATQEAILVSAITGTGPYTLACTRGYDSTTPSAHNSGASVLQGFTGADFNAWALQTATQTVTWGAGAQTADVSTAATYVVALTGNVTPVTLAGAPATGVEASLTFYFSQPATGGTYNYTVAWPGSVTWLAGAAPVIATGAGAVTVVTLETFNGGMTWYGTGPAAALPLNVASGGTGGVSLAPYQAVMGGAAATSPVAAQILPAKPPCRLAATVPLPANTAAGGQTLTATANGVMPNIDSVAPAAFDRVLVAAEPTSANNGIYYVQTLGTATTITNAGGITAGATSVTVASNTGISSGGTLRLDAGNAGAENVTVTSVFGTTISISACVNPHANGAPAGVTPWVLDRAPDMADPGTATVQVPGATTWVTSGAVNANTGWAVQGPGPFTLGTTAVSWQLVGGAGVNPGAGVIPADLGLATWTFDPGLCSSTHLPPAAGTLILSAMILRYPLTITRLAFILSSFAVGSVTGQNWIMVFPAAGGAALASADCTSLLTSGGGNSTGLVEATVTPTSLAPGQYIGGMFFNSSGGGSALPALGIYAAGAAATASAGFASFRYGQVAGGYTTAVPSLSLGSVSLLANEFWMGMGELVSQVLHRVYRGWWPGTGLVFPNALTTGVPAGTTLTTLTTATTAASVGGLNTGWSWDGVSLLTATASNAVVDSVYVPDGTVIVNNKTAVTVQNSRIVNAAGGHASNCFNLAGNFTGLTISRCTIAGGDYGNGRVDTALQDHGGGTSSGVLITGNDFSACRTAILFGSAGVISGNYIHDPGFIVADHTNGMLTPYNGGGTLAIIGNTVMNPRGQADAIMLNPNSTSTNISNTTISGNLVAGGGFAMYLGHFSGNTNTTSNIVVTGNYFSTRYFQGCGAFGTHTLYQTGGTGNVWAQNTWYDGPNAGQLIAA